MVPKQYCNHVLCIAAATLSCICNSTLSRRRYAITLVYKQPMRTSKWLRSWISRGRKEPHSNPFSATVAAMLGAPFTQTPVQGSCLEKPFDQVWVMLSKREHIQLVMDAKYWKTAHQRAVAREQWLELQKHQLLASLARYKAKLRGEFEQAQDLQRQSHQQQLQQGAQQRADLQAQLNEALAQVRDLRQRVFGRKSERSKAGGQAQSKDCHTPKPRGQQRGRHGHGRTTQAELPLRHETRDLASALCPKRGLDLQALCGVEDSRVVEIEVKAYAHDHNCRWLAWRGVR